MVADTRHHGRLASPTPAASGVSAQRWLAAGSGVSALAGTAAVAAADPAAPGADSLCPLLTLTGWWCPLCGSLRAVAHLAHGDLVGAVQFNVLLVAVLPLLAYAWLAWAAPLFGVRGPPRWRASGRTVWVAVIAAVVVTGTFGILRNMAATGWLAPGAGSL